MSNISNPKTEVRKGIKLNEKDIMMEVLTYLKDLEKNYVVALTEASNEYLFNKYLNIFESISSLQRKTYEIMFKNGWYKLETVSNTKLEEKVKLLNQELENM